MPAALAAIIPAITAATGLTELGLQLSGAGKPSTPDPTKQLQEAQEKQAQQDALAKQRMIQASLPGAQEQAGGALGEPSLLNLGTVIAGLPGEANTGAGRGALSSYLGLAPNAPQENLMTATYGLSGSQS